MPGLMSIGTYEFTVLHIWTLESLAGFAHSTSILSRSALGDHVEAFERDLRNQFFLPYSPTATSTNPASFTYDLAVKPSAYGRSVAPPALTGGERARITDRGLCVIPGRRTGTALGGPEMTKVRRRRGTVPPLYWPIEALHKRNQA